MWLSDFIKNGSQLQGPAGALAINANDLVAVAVNQIYSCQVSDFASVGNQGAVVWPQTTPTAFNSADMRNSIYYNAADASIFLVTPYLSGLAGLKVFRYTSAGVLYNSVILDSSASPAVIKPTITKLSNGNYVIVWVLNAGSAYFAIVDQYLNVIVAKTAIDAVDTTANAFNAIALSGGGFAVAYSKSNPFLAVYDNTGAVVRAGAALTNAAAFGTSVSVTLIQLSNGNIAIGITSGANSKAIGHAITTAAGANVLQVTMLDTAVSPGTPTRISMSAVTNFYCIGAMSGSRMAAFVVSLAGVIQGAEYLDASGGGGANPDMKIVNDGAMFWACYDQGSTVVAIAGLPVTGTGYTTTVFAGLATHASLDAACEHGLVIFSSGGFTYVTQINGSSNSVFLVNSFNSGSVSGGMKLLTDFSFIAWGTGTSLTGWKYLNTAIVGIAQQGLAAGNAGTAINYMMGPGAYPCSALIGTVGKGFDHSSTNIIGNKGTMLGNSASLKGI